MSSEFGEMKNTINLKLRTHFHLNWAILNTIFKYKPFRIPVFTGMTFAFIR